ncbi:MAG: histidine kinase [Pseudomonadales bacterium]|nr:histidine kinase [Pseudomonadales bacterium]
MSLRLRLSLIIVLLFVGSLALSVLSLLVSAQTRVEQEVTATVDLVKPMIETLFHDYERTGDDTGIRELIKKQGSFDASRDIGVRVVAPGRDYVDSGDDVQERIGAPAWFVNSVRPAVQRVVYGFNLGDQEQVLIFATPTAEIEEAWQEMKSAVLARVLAIFIIVMTLLALIGRWLNPVKSIIHVLDEVEKGNFGSSVPKISLPELNVIAEKINRLASVLGSSKNENDRLIRKNLYLQEKERRYLAHELHDGMGQSISAIKAIAASIRHRHANSDEQSATSAQKIVDVSSQIYASIRGMMGRLRPAVLDGIGLVPGLEQMVDEWNDHHEDTFCLLNIVGDFQNLHEDQQIHVYRIVQEALTNVAKHARAEQVTISLSGNESVRLSISDDGQGYEPESIRMGMGLTGIRERVQTLQGELVLSSGPGKGVHILIEFPRLIRDRRRTGDQSR